MLLQWGVKASDQDHVPIYFESTIEAADFYKKHGFKEVAPFSVGIWSEEKQKLEKYSEVGLVYPSKSVGKCGTLESV